MNYDQLAQAELKVDMSAVFCVTFQVGMHKGVGFVRIKPIQCEKDSEPKAGDDELFDPLIAVKVLDAETVPGEQKHLTVTEGCSHNLE